MTDAGGESSVVVAAVGAAVAFALSVSLFVFAANESVAGAEAAANRTTTSAGRLVVLWLVAALLAVLAAVSFRRRWRLPGALLAFAGAAIGFASVAAVWPGVFVLVEVERGTGLGREDVTVMTWQVLAVLWLTAAVPLVAAGLRVRVMGEGTTARAVLALAGAVVAWILSLVLLLTYVAWWADNGTWFKHPAGAWAAHVPGPIARALDVWLAGGLLGAASAFLLRRAPGPAAILAAVAAAVGLLAGPLLGGAWAAGDYYLFPTWVGSRDLSLLWVIAAVPLFLSAILVLPAARALTAVRRR